MMPTGRFAPTPTGPLHMGSLLTALASYLCVKQKNGHWLIRFDDLDSLRTVPGSADHIYRSLTQHGLVPDLPPVYQSQRKGLYDQALQSLIDRKLVYGCVCTRKITRSHQIYPGNCRGQQHPLANTALRLQLPVAELAFMDAVQGPQSSKLDTQIGDIIVRRRDGYYAYHFACAIDDGGSMVTEVVRGMDLLGDTPAQLAVMHLLGLKPPTYAHLPILINVHGQKLSKQNHAPPIDQTPPNQNLFRCLRWLGLDLPGEAWHWSVDELLEYGRRNFDVAKIPKSLPPIPAT
jgi:glutamyl-Q tRNA(Asp) synthetase